MKKERKHSPKTTNAASQKQARRLLLPSLVCRDLCDGFEHLPTYRPRRRDILPLLRSGSEEDTKEGCLISEAYYLDQPHVPLLVFVISLSDLHGSLFPCHFLHSFYDRTLASLTSKKNFVRLMKTNRPYKNGIFHMEPCAHFDGYGRSSWFWETNPLFSKRYPALLTILKTPLSAPSGLGASFHPLDRNLFECHFPYFPELCSFALTSCPGSIKHLLPEILDRLIICQKNGRMSTRSSLLCSCISCGYPAYFIDSWYLRGLPEYLPTCLPAK